MLFAGFNWSPEPELLRSPVGVVVFDELADGQANLLDVAEDSAVDGLLLEGAIEALSDQATGLITVRTRILHQQTLYGQRYRQCAVVEVQDNGPGIPEQLKDTLFYPMVSGRAGGTGLGLAITQNVVHQHAGKVEVLSEPGDTRFLLYLPYIETRSTATQE